MLPRLTGFGADIIAYRVTEEDLKGIEDSEPLRNGVIPPYQEKITLQIGPDIYPDKDIISLLSRKEFDEFDLFFFNTDDKICKMMAGMDPRPKVCIYGLTAEIDFDPLWLISSMINDMREAKALLYQIELFSELIGDPWEHISSNVIIDGKSYTPNGRAYEPEGLHIEDLKKLTDDFPILISSGFFEPGTIGKFLDIAPNLAGFTILFDAMPENDPSRRIDKIRKLIHSIAPLKPMTGME